MVWKEMLSKQRLGPLVVVVVLILGGMLYRKNLKSEDSSQGYTLTGETMGTTYKVLFAGDTLGVAEGIQNTLSRCSAVFSTYMADSEISQFNQSEKGVIASSEMAEVFRISDSVVSWTTSKFDPTLKPLIEYYGFGPDDAPRQLDSSDLASRKKLVGWNNVRIQSDSLLKNMPGVQLDFSAVAKGYGVDMVCDFLISNGISSFLDEIGGEVRAAGKKPNGSTWKIGIEDPSLGMVRQAAVMLFLENESMASSGNYRNIRTIDGVQYSHTFDGSLGVPVKTRMLSASVVAKRCAMADALATASMAIGPEKSIEWFSKRNDFKAFFIYTTTEGELGFWASPRLTYEKVKKQ